jgi:dTDP-4-amino-4,6-dideoxy-D-glucose acyltransferase
MSFLSRNKILQIGFHYIGENCQISDRAVFYNPQNITIGSNTRIDDFCILSAGEEIIIGDWVHIACYTSLIGKGLIMLKDFSGVSMRCTILSSNADYSGEFLTNPQIPEKYLNTFVAPVVLEKHALIGAGSVVLPGVSIGEGAVIGAMSFVKKSIKEYQIWAGNPLRLINIRAKETHNLEKQFKHE